MIVVDDINAFEKPVYSAVTIGTFDGVHLGHREILDQVIEDARENGGKSVLITFWPHPRFVLNKDSENLKMITTFEEKEGLLRSIGLDVLIKIPFTAEFAALTAEDFVGQILADMIGTTKLYIGYDHHFGNNREGDIDFLKSRAAHYQYDVFEIPRKDIDDIGISSTKIRKALHGGDIAFANSLLGRRYSLSGTVVEGQRVGRSIGYPTANIELEKSYKLLPGDGAYAVLAHMGGQVYNGMLNIGFKPTVNGSERTIEAHLFNFDEDIYGREIIIEFVESLRKEQKFDSLDDLKDQLAIDREKAMNILEEK